jgi:mannose-6-phosphate isomerase-like protein (cupin superfamily)
MEIFNVNQLFTHLKQDEKSDIQILKLTDGIMSMLIAELKAGKKLSAHYHNEGAEIYQVFEGEGNVELGKLSGDTVIWDTSFAVKAGDVFEVEPKVVHRLSNNTDKVLRIIFFAPPSHLGEDRVFL